MPRKGKWIWKSQFLYTYRSKFTGVFLLKAAPSSFVKFTEKSGVQLNKNMVNEKWHKQQNMYFFSI